MVTALRTPLRFVVWLLCLGVVAWGVFAGRQYLLARRAGAALSNTIESDWPEEELPPAGTRNRLLATAEAVQAGDFSTAAADLEAGDSVSPEQRAAAQRFFGEQRDLRSRFVAVVTTAKILEQDGGDVAAVRTALAGAVRAAARRNHRAALRQVKTAEAALEAVSLGTGATAVAPGRESVAGLLHQIGPSYELGRELLTEGHAAVEKLLIRARQCYDLGEFTRAAALVRLAVQLSGLTPVVVTAEAPPEWFETLEPAVLQSTGKETAEAAVNLCRSMTVANEPSASVRTLMRNASRELAEEQFGDARWWATVTLNALGMSDDEIAAATEPSAP